MPDKHQPVISVIILTWNGRSWLEQFLPSVLASDYDNLEVIIADNASEDDTGSWLGENYPKLKYVRFDQNYGYCGGNNRAAEHASGEYLFFLNNDIELAENAISALVDLAGKYPDLGAAQPKLLDFNKRDRFEYAGAAGGMIDSLGYPFCRGRIFQHIEKDQGQYDTENPVFWASGAAFFIRKVLFLEAGGFEESFGFHMEEIDLCWRLQRMGHTIRCATEAKAWHVGGGSLLKSDPRKTLLNFLNNWKMLLRNLPPEILIWKLPLRLSIDLLAALRFLFSGEPDHAKAVLHAYKQFFSDLHDTALQRRELADKVSYTYNPAGQIRHTILLKQDF